MRKPAPIEAVECTTQVDLPAIVVPEPDPAPARGPGPDQWTGWTDRGIRRAARRELTDTAPTLEAFRG